VPCSIKGGRIMKTKVVFHIDENEKWKLLTGNVHNLITMIDAQNAEIEIVANSAAVAMYKKNESGFKKELEELHTQGVRICACNNALHSMNITKAEIMEFVEVVPAGVKELIDRQADGYAYIKP
jgi:uncharacterized protein